MSTIHYWQRSIDSTRLECQLGLCFTCTYVARQSKAVVKVWRETVELAHGVEGDEQLDRPNGETYLECDHTCAASSFFI